MKRKDFIAKMREVLRRRRDALRKTLHGELSILLESNAGVGDAADFASDSDSDEISSQLAAVESRELTSIENALERLHRGEYGTCDACERDIPAARLNAVPYATHCIGCQRTAEMKQTAESRRFDWSQVEANRDELEESDQLAINSLETETA